jgi:hypothetical protein
VAVVLIVFSVYTTVGATVEQSSTKTRLGFTGIALQLTLISAANVVVVGAFIQPLRLLFVDELPHESVAVQVLVTERTSEPLVVISAEVNVKAEPQASVAVATAILSSRTIDS